ncbi:MAG: hypothetical protein JWR37_5237, partial [Mycobacterium sp.]|nr:hypothetical protein [Mycobacterium sp.]
STADVRLSRLLSTGKTAESRLNSASTISWAGCTPRSTAATMTDGDESSGEAPMLRLRAGRLLRRRAPMTIDDLRRAEEAAADLDDLGVMATAWECGTARDR